MMKFRFIPGAGKTDRILEKPNSTCYVKIHQIGSDYCQKPKNSLGPTFRKFQLYVTSEIYGPLNEVWHFFFSFIHAFSLNLERCLNFGPSRKSSVKLR